MSASKIKGAPPPCVVDPREGYAVGEEKEALDRQVIGSKTIQRKEKEKK